MVKLQEWEEKLGIIHLHKREGMRVLVGSFEWGGNFFS
jgi:hypothetical protein